MYHSAYKQKKNIHFRELKRKMTLTMIYRKKVHNLCNEWSLKVINQKLYIIRKFELTIEYFIHKIVNHSENSIYLQTGARIKHIKK